MNIRSLSVMFVLLFSIPIASANSVYYPGKGNGDGTFYTYTGLTCTNLGASSPCARYNEGSLRVDMDLDTVKYQVQNSQGIWRYIQYDIPNPMNLIPSPQNNPKSLVWMGMYANNTNLRYVMQSHGIKLDIWGNDTPPSNYFNFTYTLSAGVTYQMQGEEILFMDTVTGEPLWLVKYPTMHVNKTDVPLTFKKDGNKISIHAPDLFTSGYNFSAGWELDPSTQSGSTIYISDRQNLTQVYNDIANVTALSHDSLGNCSLNANLVNNNTANRFYMNTTDSLCYASLRINSTHTETGNITWYYLTNGQTEIDYYKITSWNTTSNTVENLPVSTWARSAVYASGASSKMNISNSNLSYLGYNVANMYGVSYGTSSGNQIINNSFLQNYIGILLSSSLNNNLTSNTGTSNTSYGILLSSSSNNNTLTSNTGTSNTSVGILLSSSLNNNLTSNTGTSNTSYGIQLSSSSNNNTLTSNTGTSDTSYGIYLLSSSNNNLTSNTGTSNTSVGIYLYSSSNNNTLTSNTGTSNTSVGIYLYSSSNNNTLTSNTGTSNTSYGILLSSSSNNNTLTSNTGTSNTGVGIQLSSSSNNNTLTSNTGTSNTGVGIYLSSSLNNNLTSNTFNTNSTTSTVEDIVIDNSGRNNTFINTDFTTKSRKIEFNDALLSEFNQSQDGGVSFVNTNLSIARTTNRSIVNWNQSNITFIELFTGTNMANYSAVGLLSSTTYTVYNNSVLNYTLITDSGGVLPTFTINHTTTSRTITINATAEAPPTEDDYIPPAPINLAQTNSSSGFWINHTWQNGTGNITNSYNVSVNGTWTNGSITNFSNGTVLPHGWRNITVWAFNSSGNGNLSNASVSMNTQIPNNVPTISAPANWSGGEETSVSMDYDASDIDNDDLTFSTNAIYGQINSTTGIFTWGSPVGGNYSWTVTATDNYTASISYTSWINISDTLINAPSPPIYVPESYQVLNGAFDSGAMNHTYYNDSVKQTFKEISGNGLTFNYSINLSAAPSTSIIYNISINGRYNGSGSSSHYFNVQILNTTSSVLEQLTNASYRFDYNEPDDVWRNFTVTGSHYRNATGHMILQFNHSVSASYQNTHRFWVDQVQIRATPTYTPSVPVISTVTTGNFYINTTWNTGAGNITDGYNSTNGTVWINNTLPYRNTTLSAHAWQNLSIYAHNSSGGGTLNLTALTNNTQVPNNLPVISNASNKNVDENTIIYVDIDATDADTDTLTFSTNGTNFTDFDTTTGKGNWTANYSSSGTYYIDFGVGDGYGVSNTTVTITIANVPLSITSQTPTTPVTTTIGTSQTFTAEVNRNANYTWMINSTTVQTNTTVSTASYINSTAGVGNYNITVNITDGIDIVSYTWDWNVTAVPTYSISGYTFDNNLAVLQGVLVQNGTNQSTSNSLGYYSITGMSNGTYNFTFNKTGFDNAYSDITVNGASLTNQNKTIWDNSSPTQVTGLINGTVTSSKINISWNPATDANLWGYRIYRNDTIIANVTTLYYNDTGLNASTLYQYIVRANDSYNNWGLNSTTLNVNTSLPEYNISGYVFDNNNAVLNVVSVANGSFTATTNSIGYYKLTGITNGTRNFSYTKTGFNTGYLEVTISGADNTTANITILNTLPPASISGISSSVTTTTITWSWTNPADSDFNYTSIYLDGVFQTNSSSTSYEASGLSASTSYTIATKTVDTYGNINTTWQNNTAQTIDVAAVSTGKTSGNSFIPYIPSETSPIPTPTPIPVSEIYEQFIPLTSPYQVQHPLDIRIYSIQFKSSCSTPVFLNRTGNNIFVISQCVPDSFRVNFIVPKNKEVSQLINGTWVKSEQEIVAMTADRTYYIIQVSLKSFGTFTFKEKTFISTIREQSFKDMVLYIDRVMYDRLMFLSQSMSGPNTLKDMDKSLYNNMINNMRIGSLRFQNTLSNATIDLKLIDNVLYSNLINITADTMVNVKSFDVILYNNLLNKSERIKLVIVS